MLQTILQVIVYLIIIILEKNNKYKLWNLLWLFREKAEENDKELNPIEDLFTLKRENISNSEESPEYNLNEDKRELNSYIKELINKVHSLGNLRVYAMDEEGNTVYETKGDQNWLLEALAKGSYIENGDLENYYRFYMVLKYNNRGKVSLEKIYGEDSPG